MPTREGGQPDVGGRSCRHSGYLNTDTRRMATAGEGATGPGKPLGHNWTRSGWLHQARNKRPTGTIPATKELPAVRLLPLTCNSAP